jgi:hypothetical protein
MVIATRYLRVSKVEKGRILDELCATTGWHCVSELITHFRVLLANIVGFPGGWSLPVVAVPGKPVNPGLFEPGLAGLTDGFVSSFVFVVGGDVADAGVEPDTVVVRPGDLQLGAQGGRIADGESGAAPGSSQDGSITPSPGKCGCSSPLRRRQVHRRSRSVPRFRPERCPPNLAGRWGSTHGGRPVPAHGRSAQGRSQPRTGRQSPSRRPS